MLRTQLLLLSFFIWVLLCAGSPKKSYDSSKRRIERAEQELAEGEQLSAPSSSSTGPVHPQPRHVLPPGRDPRPALPPDADPLGSRSVARRLERASDVSVVPGIEAVPFNRNLLKRWASGRLSAKAVQDIALDATLQGLPHADRIASAGAYGTRPSHIQNQLANMFGYPRGVPKVAWAMVPTKAGRVAHPFFFLPHEFFRSLYFEERETWIRSVRGVAGAARQYWESIRGSDIFLHHGYLSEANLPWLIPLGLHRDGGQFSHQNSLFVITWNSLVAGGPFEGFSPRFCIYGFP